MSRPAQGTFLLRGVARFYDRVLMPSPREADGAGAVYALDTLLMFLFGSVLWQIPRSAIERERLIRVAVAIPSEHLGLSRTQRSWGSAILSSASSTGSRRSSPPGCQAQRGPSLITEDIAMPA